MRILRKSCAQGAEEAEGLVVIIDVFRAFSCEPIFFHFGANRVILEADPEQAIARKRANPEFVLVGEVNEVPIKGADLGNSPTHIIQRGASYFRDKTVIHRTTAGVTGATAAFKRADEVVLGGFVTAKATAGYIKGKKPDLVTLVAMGTRAERPAPEDEACADYFEHLLTGKPYDPVQAFNDIVFQPTAQKFLSDTKEYLPREDPIFCLQRDLFDFVLMVRGGEGGLEVKSVRNEN
ncbi:MAG: 2-phosphosulfolactate phosphatase [Proteobacteria bacterium]|nr:2-phosphosulfolactate phosphatase [Desulfobacterales bacterium]MBL6967163.1 2-phosphosulfolactate phosphatase [Desulfobacteraceae bacterium]MBL7172566.1 2-phosphosulfolactate phosphatase [Desulfobacteraceae bacterium]MBU0735374.1 2-phosphosulfolactate phosphatase [Pseudomonadota bacterium]MBU1902709.1 2-phosphosulfolactate phosphatase [Pseudomonadota bacterium]